MIRAGSSIRRAVALALAVTALAVAVPPAHASSPVASFSATTSTQVAGGNPDLAIQFRPVTIPFDSSGGEPALAPVEYLRSVQVQLPPGLLANAAAIPTCGESELDVGSVAACPPSSQVGVFVARFANAADPTQPFNLSTVPIFNQAPLPGQAARFAIPIEAGLVVAHIDVTVRDDSDYGVTATVQGITSYLTLDGFDLDLWGVPAATSHDSQHLGCFDGGAVFYPNCTSHLPGSTTFLVNPTSCPGTPVPVTATVSFWGDPATYSASSQLPPTTGCGSLPFHPSLSLVSGSGQAGQPDAVTASLTVPQADPNDLSSQTTSALRDVSIELPQGVSLSAGAAGGLTACSDAQFNLGSHAEQTCPDSSQIGTVTVSTPLLTAPLTGHVFVGQQQSSDPASGNMYRLFVAADGSGVRLKLIGHVAVDPSTGRLTATFSGNPQVQFSSLQLSLKGGPRAPLANPDSCGTATSNWSMTPYANPAQPVTGSSDFPVSGNCGLGTQFSPSLSAGLSSNRAGGSSPFSFTLTRPDGQRVITGIPSVVLPLGLNADIASVQQCASAAAGVCPADAQVGVASIAAGQGTSPFNLTGQPVYLTGPYDGAPFGLAEVIHAVAGPFDLGTVVVRQALHVDPTTAQVTINSDPLPTMLGGVPLDLQSISLTIDRPGFMRSPTSCRAGSITASVQGSPLGAAARVAPGSDVGFATSASAPVTLTQPLRMGSCQALAFSPKLGIALAAAHRTKPGSHPQLTATLTQPAGQANLRSAAVTLPLSLALDQRNAAHVCSVAAAAKIACPASTVVGSAAADTRILPHPLTGKVYLVQGIRYDHRHRAHKTLPTLLVPLRGADHVAIDLTAKTSVDAHERLVTTFPSIPDAGIARFTLRISGGKKGILVVTGSRNLCAASRSGLAHEAAQSGDAHYGTFALGVGSACHRR